MRLSDISSLALSLGLALSNAAHAAVIKTSQNVCTVRANGNHKDDVPNILRAFHQCGNGGKIIFPEDQSYWIATRLNPVINDVVIEWRGKWTVSNSFNPTGARADQQSSPRTWITGATIHTQLLSRTTTPASSSPDITSPSMDTARVALMETAMSGIRLKQEIRSQEDRCLLFSGTCPRST